VRTVPIARRANKVRAEEVAVPPGDDRSFAAFVRALPDVLVARDFRRVVAAIAAAARARRAVIVMVGGHVVKTGLAPLLIDLTQRGVVTHIAMNGSGAIHDYEMARFGGTSEDVAAGLRDGTFGMAEETGRGMNEAITAGMAAGLGMGEALGNALAAETALAEPDSSLLLQAPRFGAAVTVHAAIGAEFIHQHPAADGAAIGATSLLDFRRLAAVVAGMEGGVYLNVGSAVVLPEVFLKTVSLGRNLGHPLSNITTVNMDFLAHYRPLTNVVRRPTQKGGKGYSLIGHHEIMLPLLVAAVAEELGSRRT
jgi:hypothetical protein